MIKSDTPNHNLAQMSIVGLMMVFLGLMILGSLTGTIADTATSISNTLLGKGYAEESVIAKLIPMFILVTFLATIVMYGAPQT